MRRRNTAWHPLYICLLRLVLPRPGFSVRSEVQLSQQPLRIDYVVVRRHQLPPDLDGPLRTARLFYEAPITLGEIKGPKDVLHGADFQWLLGYEEIVMTLEESIEQLLRNMPAERRLKGLPAEERLRGTSAEERLNGLSAEELERLRILLKEPKTN